MDEPKLKEKIKKEMIERIAELQRISEIKSHNKWFFPNENNLKRWYETNKFILYSRFQFLPFERFDMFMK